MPYRRNYEKHHGRMAQNMKNSMAQSIISHTFKKAIDANIGDVYVATEDQEIVDDVIKNGGQAIITGKNHKTGSDRIYEAFNKIGKSDIELVMNLQGDEPLINLDDIRSLHKQMIISKSKLGTSASNISDKNLYSDPNVCLLYTSPSPRDRTRSRMPSSA